MLSCTPLPERGGRGYGKESEKRKQMIYKQFTIEYGGAGFYHFSETNDCESKNKGVGRSYADCKRQIDDMISDLEDEKYFDIDNGRDFSDYTDSEGGEVVFHN